MRFECTEQMDACRSGRVVDRRSRAIVHMQEDDDQPHRDGRHRTVEQERRAQSGQRGDHAARRRSGKVADAMNATEQRNRPAALRHVDVIGQIRVARHVK